MKLTPDAVKMQTSQNAGGSSIESETLSCELLKKCYNAKLLKTELEIVYFPEGGSMTDYVVLLFGKMIGVSVTRAMKFDETDFTVEDANSLLRKKLEGINQSSKNSLIKWHKQILHIWARNGKILFPLLSAWIDLDLNIKKNTVLMVTVAEKSKEIFNLNKFY